MSNIRSIEMRIIEGLFESNPGFVLDFSNRTFAEFFLEEVGINIDDPVYDANGTSKGKRFRTFLQIGQKSAVVKALTALWEYREANRRRSGAAEMVPGDRQELSAIIERLGGKPLWGGDYYAPAAAPRPAMPDPPILAQLETEFAALHALNPQPRGYAFERFLKSLFDVWDLEARDAFRVIGEQIDGSFQLGDATYLVEAKWQNAQTDVAALRSFQGKVEDRPDWTRGLFVSYSGFTEPSLLAFSARRVILMDGLDIYDALRRRLSIAKVISAKARRASETRNAFVRVRNLFSE